MFPFRSRLFAFAAAVFVTTAFATGADAGWVTIKNDTSKAIVVQEVVLAPNGQVMRGKPTKLLAGESFREFQTTPGAKSYEVFDAADATAAVWSGSLPCPANSQSFSVATVQGKVGVIPVPEKRR